MSPLSEFEKRGERISFKKYAMDTYNISADKIPDNQPMLAVSGKRGENPQGN